jgi:hypothetical protein
MSVLTLQTFIEFYDYVCTLGYILTKHYIKNKGIGTIRMLKLFEIYPYFVAEMVG